MWALYSPNLITSLETEHSNITLFSTPFSRNDKAWLEGLHNNPEEITAFIEKNHSNRLGKYFEVLLSFFFKTHPDFELIEHGLQVFENKRTIGEFDFIIKDLRRDIVIHLEAAVKFFIQISKKQSDSVYSYWVGPACKDRFDLKLSKLSTKQCQLSETADGKKVLQSLIGNIPIHKCVLLKGCLFTHYRDTMKVYPHSTPNHLGGIWLTLDELNDPLFSSSEWTLLNRLDWLTGVQDPEPLSTTQLINHCRNIFSQKPLEKQPLMVSGNSDIDTISRYFIIPQNWPLLLEHTRPH